MRRRHPTHSDAASSKDFFGLKKIQEQTLYAGVVQRLVFRSSKPGMGCRNPSLAPYADILKRLKRCVLKIRRGVKACGGSNPPIRAASQRSLHVAMLFSLILYICSVRQVVKSQDFHSWITRSIRVRSTTHPESCFVLR